MCVNFSTSPVLPSPKSQEYDAILPSMSEEPSASKFISNGACPDIGDAVKYAVGGVFTTVTCTLSAPLR